MSLVLFALDAGIARMTLNRPEKRNALNQEMIAAIRDALASAAVNPDVRVVLIAGAGKDFCAGLDLLALDRGADAGVLDHMETARQLADIYLAIRRHPRPILAAVQGRALGGGMGLATAADLCIAAESAQFGYPEVKIGFVPAIVAALLRRSVSEKRMFELLATGDPVSSTRAAEIGLINRVFPDAGFESSAATYAANLASKSASALSLTKSLLEHTDSMPLEKAIEAGVRANALARMTEDAQRGFEAFQKKR